MPGIPNQVVVVTGNLEVVTEALGHSWRPRPTGRPDGVSPERPAVPEDGSSAAPGAGRDHRRPDGAGPARGGRLPGRSRQARPAPRGRRTPADPVAQCRRMPRIRSSASWSSLIWRPLRVHSREPRIEVRVAASDCV